MPQRSVRASCAPPRIHSRRLRSVAGLAEAWPFARRLRVAPLRATGPKPARASCGCTIRRPPSAPAEAFVMRRSSIVSVDPPILLEITDALLEGTSNRLACISACQPLGKSREIDHDALVLAAPDFFVTVQCAYLER